MKAIPSGRLAQTVPLPGWGLPGRLKPLVSLVRDHPILCLLALSTALRIALAASLPLTPDEAYYRLWSFEPAFGYADHPPMVAWLMAVSRPVFGDSPLALRLPFILLYLPLTAAVFETAQTLFNSQVIARRAALWLNASLLLSFGSIFATPDGPSTVLWALTVLAIAKLAVLGFNDHPETCIWWMVIGELAGLGVLAKYTNLFLGAGLLVWLLVTPAGRRWLKTPWPYIGGALALIMVAPNLYWNATHDWLTLHKQFGRAVAHAFVPRYLGELLVTQGVLINPAIAGLAALAVVHLSRFPQMRSGVSLIACLAAPALLYALFHALHDRVQGNWLSPLFPLFTLLAAVAATTGRSPWLRRLVWPLAIILGGMATTYLLAPPASEQRLDHWKALAIDLRAQAHRTHAGFVATSAYGLTAELLYGKPEGTAPVIAIAEASRYGFDPTLTTYASLAGQRGMIVVPAKAELDLSLCFDELRPLRSLPNDPLTEARSGLLLYTGRLTTPACDLKPLK